LLFKVHAIYKAALALCFAKYFVNVFPLVWFDFEFPFSLVQSVFERLMPCVCPQSIATKMEKVIPLGVGIVLDLKRLEGRKRAYSFAIAYPVDGSSRTQMLWAEQNRFNRDHLRLFGHFITPGYSFKLRANSH
jgi:hypothetical protein